MRSWLSAVVVVLYFGAWTWAQQCTVEVIPPNPTTADDVQIRIKGAWPNNCPKVTYSTFIIGPQVYITGSITTGCNFPLPIMTTWEKVARLGQLPQGVYWVSVNIVDREHNGHYSCVRQLSFRVQPSPWVPPSWPTWPRPDHTAQLQAWLTRGGEYFAIARQANASLSDEEKRALAHGIMPILAQGQALLGGDAALAAQAQIPPELLSALRGLAAHITSAVSQTLTAERIGLLRGLRADILKPMDEVLLLPPQTNWMCYWSYVYAWWTWIYAYWTYIIYDQPLAYWTMVYSYYSLWYAYYCYLSCPRCS